MNCAIMSHCIFMKKWTYLLLRSVLHFLYFVVHNFCGHKKCHNTYNDLGIWFSNVFNERAFILGFTPQIQWANYRIVIVTNKNTNFIFWINILIFSLFHLNSSLNKMLILIIFCSKLQLYVLIIFVYVIALLINYCLI